MGELDHPLALARAGTPQGQQFGRLVAGSRHRRTQVNEGDVASERPASRVAPDGRARAGPRRWTTAAPPREGGITTTGVVGALDTALDGIQRDGAMHGTGQVQVFSARAEFPEAWRAFVAGGNNDGETTLALDLSEQRFPHPQVPPGDGRSVEFIAIFARWPADDSIAPAPAGTVFVGAGLKPPDPGQATLLAQFTAYKPHEPVQGGAANYNYLWAVATDTELGEALGTWNLVVPNGWPDDHAPEDIIVVVGHKVT